MDNVVSVKNSHGSKNAKLAVKSSTSWFLFNGDDEKEVAEATSLKDNK